LERLTSASDEELMTRYRDTSDQAAFAELLQRLAPELGGYLRRIVGSATADDVLQLTFLHVHQNREAYTPGRPVRPWVYAIATHLAIDWLRKSKHHRTVSLDQPGHSEDEDHPHALAEYLQTRRVPVEVDPADDEKSVWARRTVEQLPEALRSAVLLVYLQGLTYAEAASALGIPIGTVKSRVHRALRRLAEESTQRHRGKSARPCDRLDSFHESQSSRPDFREPMRRCHVLKVKERKG
jgi:RNA polymerase sigma-70 factor (ECF subfamily)